MLVLPDGEVVCDSELIVDRLWKTYPDAIARNLGTLYPADIGAQVRELELELAHVLGANIRQLAYTHLLEPAFLEHSGPWFSRGSSTVEAVLFNLVKPVVAKGMIRLMRCKHSRIPKVPPAAPGPS